MLIYVPDTDNYVKIILLSSSLFSKLINTKSVIAVISHCQTNAILKEFQSIAEKTYHWIWLKRNDKTWLQV